MSTSRPLYTHRVRTDDGISISVYEKKPVHPVDKPRAVLLIHSATFSALPEFDLQVGDYSLMDFLAGRGLHVYALDIRGYGTSDRPSYETWVTIDVATKDVHAAVNFIIQTMGIPSVGILGWSWGTQIAGLFAQDYPALVDRLILYAPFWHGVNVDIPEQSVTRRENTPEDAVSDFVDRSRVDPTVMTKFAEQCMQHDRTSPTGSRCDLRLLREKPILDPSRIKIPALVIYGRDDHLIIKEDVDTFFNALGTQEKKLVIIDNADHMAHLELNRKIFHDAVGEFFLPTAGAYVVCAPEGEK